MQKHKINKNALIFFILFIMTIRVHSTSLCGCKTLRPCYEEMVATLRERDEESCIEDAAIGASTMMIFLRAIKQFCPEVITVNSESLTYEGRHLYEVILSASSRDGKIDEDSKPVILIDAGQQGGTEPVGLALYLVEQLVGCQEFNEMIEKVKWVILPCTNPDGMEYARFNRVTWKKNLRPSEDKLSYGVDISRNFESQWGACERVNIGFSPVYPGPVPASENETIFIKNILSKYKKDVKTYVSLRRDGHGLMYPYAHRKVAPPNGEQVIKLAADAAAKVNQRAAGVQIFLNESIFESNGKPHCGHSVDYAFDAGIPYAYEMRVFLGHDNRIMSKFQTFPKGHESSLRSGYFSGIRYIYNAITSEKKHGKVF